MTITTPYSLANFADLLKFAKVSFSRKENDEMSGLGSGQILTANLAPKLWIADISLAKVFHSEAMQLQALIEALDGSLGTFYLYNPLAKYPQSDPTGSIFGASTPTIHTLNSDNKRMRVQGLPSTYRLTRGDMISWDYSSGTKRAFHRIVETVTAVAGLTPLFEVRPHIRVGSTTGLAVTLIKPAGKFLMVPDSFRIESNDDLLTSTIQFQAIQTL